MRPPLRLRSAAVLPVALLLAAACSDEESDVEVLLATHAAPAPLQAPGLLHVDLRASGLRYRATGGDFTTERYATLHSPRLSLSAGGELRATVTMVAAPSDTLGRVALALPVQAKHHYGIAVKPGGSRPLGVCVGQVVWAPLRRPGNGAPTDTLWVSYGGLPDGAVC